MRLRARLAPAALWTLLAAGCVVSGDAGALTTTDSETTSQATTTTSSTSGDASTGPDKLDVGARDVATQECVSVGQTTTITERPSDVLVVVDRALDGDQMAIVFDNLSLAIGNELVEDIRVVMIAGLPPDGVCVSEPPLGIGQCPSADHNPPLYRHIEEAIDGSTLLQQLLDTSSSWVEFLRADARTHVLVMATREPTMDPQTFDAAFETLSPSLVGYTMHVLSPYNEPPDTCSTVAMGETWSQAEGLRGLSVATGGLDQNVCNYFLDDLFSTLLDSFEVVSLACEYEIPPAPDGLVFDQGEVNVDYAGGGSLETVGYVESLSDCPSVTDGWYYDDNLTPDEIRMCPQTCARFQMLAQASIEIRFGCTTIPAG